MLAQCRPDTGQQFLNGKGLREIIIRAEIEPADLVLDFIPCREHDDRHIRQFPYLAANGHAIHLRQHDIQQHQCIVPLDDALERPASIVLTFRLKALMLQLHLQIAGNAPLVLNNEYFQWLRHKIPPFSPSETGSAAQPYPPVHTTVFLLLYNAAGRR